MPRRGRQGNGRKWPRLGALWESDKGILTGNLQFLGIEVRIVILESDIDTANAPDFIIYAPEMIKAIREEEEEEGQSTRKRGGGRKKKAPAKRKPKKKVEEEEEEEDEEEEDDDDIPF